MPISFFNYPNDFQPFTGTPLFIMPEGVACQGLISPNGKSKSKCEFRVI